VSKGVKEGLANLKTSSGQVGKKLQQHKVSVHLHQVDGKQSRSQYFSQSLETLQKVLLQHT
jgi:hypothetical protein